MTLPAGLHLDNDLAESWRQLVEWGACWRLPFTGVLHRFSIHRLGGKMEGNDIICSWAFAGTFLDDFVSNSSSCFLSISRGLGRLLDFEQLDIKTKHPTRATAARNLRAIGKVLRDPEATFLTRDHEL